MQYPERTTSPPSLLAGTQLAAEPQLVMDKWVDGWVYNDTLKLWLVSAEGASGGSKIRFRTNWQRALSCLEHYLVVRKNGQYAGHVKASENATTVTGDCVYEVQLFAEGVSPSDTVTVEFYETVTKLSEIKEGKAEPQYQTKVSLPSPEVVKSEPTEDPSWTGEWAGGLPAGDGFASGLDSIESIVQWGTVFVGGAAALWFGFPLVMAGREALQDATNEDTTN